MSKLPTLAKAAREPIVNLQDVEQPPVRRALKPVRVPDAIRGPLPVPPARIEHLQPAPVSGPAARSAQKAAIVGPQPGELERREMLALQQGKKRRQPQQAMTEGTFMIPGLQTKRIEPAEIKAAFDAIDLDKNGTLDASDLRQMCILAGEVATDQEIEQMLRMVDHDASDHCTFSEFQELFLNPPPLFRNFDLGQEEVKRRGIIQDETEEVDQAAVKRTQRLALMSEFSGGRGLAPAYIKQVFQKFQEVDADDSGLIDYVEFCQVLEQEDSPMMRRLFQLFDKDDSGEIELKEFIVGLTNYTSAAPEDKLAFAFDMFDDDGSGFLERDELIKILKANPKFADVNEEDLDLRASELLVSVGLQQHQAVSRDDFDEMAKRNPDLLVPAFEIVSSMETRMMKELGPTRQRDMAAPKRGRG